ncbi:WXG100 family type VII secretion target [Streptomyces mirabilis]
MDTDGLARTVPALHQLGEQLRSVHTGLVARLSALDGCWGDDATGERFLSQYQGPADQLMTGMAGTGNVLDSIPDGVSTMGKGFGRTEAINGESLRGLGGSGSGNFLGSSVSADPGVSGDTAGHVR